ncbi:hypothetical protein GCM10022237_28840 [Nocardioides ginsengisoli]|uniref:Peptidase M23 domain-containing protein n=1 Tax=Nocardioides ginsengisoli TaxID=363868 RepID=A0ABW3W2Q9_9ACTN
MLDEALGKYDTTTVIRKLNLLGQWGLPDLVNTDTDVDGTGDPADPDGGDDPADPDPAALTAGKASPLAENPQAQPSFVLTEDSPDAAGTPTTSGATSRSVAAAEASIPTYLPCSFIVDAHPVRSVNVVEFHNASNSNGKWTYGESADTDLEGGIDYAGDDKGWSAHGSGHIGNSKGATVYRSYSGGSKANNYGTSTFKYTDGHYQGYGQGKWCQDTTISPGSYVKVPGSWYGGVGSNTADGSEFIGCAKSPQSGHRNEYPKGSGFTRDKNSSAKIGAAVNLGPIKVGARSGYSKNVVLHWDVVRGHGIWLCGTNYGPIDAGVIHAQNQP